MSDRALKWDAFIQFYDGEMTSRDGLGSWANDRFSMPSSEFREKKYLGHSVGIRVAPTRTRTWVIQNNLFSTGIFYLLRKSFLLSEKTNLAKINRNIFWIESRVNDIFPIYFFGLSDPWNSRLKFKRIWIIRWNPRW